MVGGKTFLISFAIGATMGGNFQKTMLSTSTQLMKVKNETKILQNNARSLQQAFRSSQAEVLRYQSAITLLNAKLKSGNISQEEYNRKIKETSIAMDAAIAKTQRYQTALGTKQAAIAKNQKEMQAMANRQMLLDKANNNLSTSFSAVAMTMSRVGMVAAPFVGVVNTAMDFEAAMSKVKAITRASNDEMNLLSETAQKLGRTTQFSATQAADAMSYLGMAGWNSNQIISGMPGLLALAAAGNVDLARTADIVSDDLTAFGLSADQAGHMADVFAVTVTRTNTNVEMLGDTMKYAAPVAKAFGASMEETAALAGLMANSGIKASQAGTALRAGFLRLAGPPKMASKAMEQLGMSMSDITAEQKEASMAMASLGISITDTTGKQRKMSAILTELKNKTADLGQEEKLATMKAIFGQEAATGWLAVLDAGPETFDKLVNEMENCDGEAQRMAETMTNNAKGGMIKLKSALEGLAISLGAMFLPMLAEGAQWLANIAEKMAAWSQEHPGVIKAIGMLTAGLGGLFIGFKVFTFISAGIAVLRAAVPVILQTVFGTTRFAKAANLLGKGFAKGQLIQTIRRIILASSSLRNTFSGLTRLSSLVRLSPIGIAIMAITGAINILQSRWAEFAPIFTALADRIKNAFVNTWSMLSPAITSLMTSLSGLWASAEEGTGVFGILSSIMSFITEILGTVLIGAIIMAGNILVNVFSTQISVATAIITGFIGILSGVIDFIVAVFTGQWGAAWQAVVNIFSTIFGTISDIAHSVLDGILSTVSGIANGISTLMGLNTGGNKIPGNAQGGIYQKGAFLTTFAEEGPEAAIPLDGSPRAIGLWRKAGEMLGMGSGEGTINLGGTTINNDTGTAPALAINFSMNFYGPTEPQQVQKAVESAGRKLQESFAEKMAAFNHERRRLAYE